MLTNEDRGTEVQFYLKSSGAEGYGSGLNKLRLRARPRKRAPKRQHASRVVPDPVLRGQRTSRRTQPEAACTGISGHRALDMGARTVGPQGHRDTGLHTELVIDGSHGVHSMLEIPTDGMSWQQVTDFQAREKSLEKNLHTCQVAARSTPTALSCTHHSTITLHPIGGHAHSNEPCERLSNTAQQLYPSTALSRALHPILHQYCTQHCTQHLPSTVPCTAAYQALCPALPSTGPSTVPSTVCSTVRSIVP